MRKSLLIVALAAIAGGAPIALAGPHEKAFRRHEAPPSEDLAAFADARIAALKAGLKLTAEQEKNWPALETALRDAVRAQTARMEAHRDNGPPAFDADPLGAMQRRARNMTERAGELDKIAAAAKPLYDSLDDGQKRRFATLIRAAVERRMRGMGHMGRGGFGAGPD
jgi:hypothetical protein